MGGVGGVEGDGPGDRDLGGPPGMDVGRGEEADPRVAVLRVVPLEEGGAEGPGVLERAEAGGKGRPVLEGLEPRGGQKTRFDHAATPSYSWMSPPSRARRRTSRGSTGIGCPSVARGEARPRAWCGRPRL